MLLEKRLPGRQEHGSADVQPNPLPVISPGRIDDGAVPDVLRRRPAGFGRVGAGGGRRLSRLVVFVVVVVIVVAVVSVATGVRRRRADVRGSPLAVRCSCHLEPEDGLWRVEGAKASVRLRLPTRSAHCPNPRDSREGSVAEQQHIRLVLSKQEYLDIHCCFELTKLTLPFID